MFCCRHCFHVAQHPFPGKLILKLMQTLILAVHLKCQLNFFHKFKINSKRLEKHFSSFMPVEHAEEKEKKSRRLLTNKLQVIKPLFFDSGTVNVRCDLWTMKCSYCILLSQKYRYKLLQHDSRIYITPRFSLRCYFIRRAHVFEAWYITDGEFTIQ